MTLPLVLGSALAFVIVVYLLASMTVVPEYKRCVVFRLGRLTPLRGPGLIAVWPIFERKRLVDLRTVTVDVPPQDVITRDSVTVKVDAVLYYRIVDPVRSAMSVVNLPLAIDLASLTTLRSVIGQHELDVLLKSRDAIDSTLRTILGTLAEPWGIQVEMVDIKAVDIPTGMQRAMAKEAEAMREKRARIIKAEAEEEASVKLVQASERIAQSPFSLELRRMQMISEVGSEQNTTTIIMMPSEFVSAARAVSENLGKWTRPAA